MTRSNSQKYEHINMSRAIFSTQVAEIGGRPRRRAEPVPTVIFHKKFFSVYFLCSKRIEMRRLTLLCVCNILCPALFFFVGGGCSLHINNGAELRDCIVEVVGLGKSPAQSVARGPRGSVVPLKEQNTEICPPPPTLDSVFLTEGSILDICF